MKSVLLLLNTLLIIIVICLILFSHKECNSDYISNNDSKIKEIIAIQNTSVSVLNSNQQNGILDSLIQSQNLKLDSNVLVVKYSAFGCKNCIDYIISKIKVAFPDYKNNDQILLLSSDCSNGLSLGLPNVINMDQYCLGLDIEQTMIPFLFMYSERRINHIFIPDSSFPEQMDAYIESIKRRYIH